MDKPNKRRDSADFPFLDCCDRCGDKTTNFTMSWFNTEWLCPLCDRAELQHPKIHEAKQAELDAVRSGDYNFPGIGKPEDL